MRKFNQQLWQRLDCVTVTHLIQWKSLLVALLSSFIIVNENVGFSTVCLGPPRIRNQNPAQSYSKYECESIDCCASAQHSPVEATLSALGAAYGEL